MTKFIKSFFLVLSVIVVVFVANTGFGNQGKIIGIDDGLRHLKFAEILDKHGYFETYNKYNWGNLTEYSILTDYNSDLWEGFHFLLVSIMKFGFKDLDVLKVYISLCIGLIFLIFLILGEKLKIPFIITSVLFLFFIFNPDVISRISLARPFTLSVIFYYGVIFILISKRKIYIPIIFLIGTFFHALYFMLLLPVLFYIFAYKVDVKKTLHIFLLALLGIALGILIHQNSLNYLILSAITFFYIPLCHIIYGAGASELYSTNILIMPLTWIFLCIFGYYFFIDRINREKIEKTSKNQEIFFLMINLCILGGLSTIMGRFSDYFIFGLYFSLFFIIRKILDLEKDFSKKVLHFNNSVFYVTGTILLLFIGSFMVFFTVYQNKSFDIKKETSFLSDNKDKIKTGSNIITFTLLDFPMTFYALGEDYKYISTMEPYYLFLKDKDKFNQFNDIFSSFYREPKNKELKDNFYGVVKNYYADYLVFFGNYYYTEMSYQSRELLKIKVNIIKNDKRFELIASDRENYIWKIIK